MVVGGFEHRAGATVVVVVALAVLVAPAIPVNLTTESTSGAAIAPTDGANAAETFQGASVGDYTVYYAENVTNREYSVIDLSAFNQSTVVNASGVIVESDRRHIWTTAVQKSRLSFAGCATVGVGGIGWRDSIHVSRNGWHVAGGGHAYKIRFGRGDDARLAYLSNPARAEPTIQHRNVSVVPRRTGFGLVVSRANETLGRTPIPKNGTARAGNLTFTREDGDLFAAADGTRVEVAKHENYH